MKRTLRSLENQPLEGLRALVRVDFNVPIKEGRVADATRIRAALPTIAWLRDRGCRVLLLSHLGRPNGKRAADFSLVPVAQVLEKELGVPIQFFEEPLAPDMPSKSKRLRRGEVALLENTRFHSGETANDPKLARAWAELADFYVNDAFGAAHRAHASTEAVAHMLKPAVAGFLMERELEYLEEKLANPSKPFVAIIGGAKISGKIDVIHALLPQVDDILIGGAMASTFFLALGLNTGASLVEADSIDLATRALEAGGTRIVLPTDVVVANELATNTANQSVSREAIPNEASVYDIGPETRNDFAQRIVRAKTVVWNGPMGVFEVPPFDAGTNAIAHAVAEATDNGATTIVGGGDSVAALAAANLAERVSHVSTGGGASLELLGGKSLPGVVALDDA